MFVDPGEEQREKELWIKRWNTMKNWVDAEAENIDNANCCTGTLILVKRAMEAVEEMTDDEQV
jgi:hypothetical protein